MQSIAARMVVYSLFVIGVFVIIWCNISGVPPKYRHELANPSPSPSPAPVTLPPTLLQSTTGQTTVSCAAAESTAFSKVVDVVFVAKWAYRNMKVTRIMSRCLKSMLSHTKSSVRFHVLADPQSYMRLSRTLNNVQVESKKKFRVRRWLSPTLVGLYTQGLPKPTNIGVVFNWSFVSCA
ncbi:hypothetical protein HPB48_007445 [Haemaphysalis longicornis]|uniref:Uncharacterized protein n=1 Tax=Haemaphysalis longicornis TaxID=44386 RepID=A0A9J6GGC5_HAELO|nr:hypothetical protein HPB48_007445 [Haemaphysalis longicornis]